MSWLESIINMAGAAVLGIAAATQLYQAWRLATADPPAGRRPTDDRHRARRVTLRGPNGEYVVVWASPAMLEEWGLLHGGDRRHAGWPAGAPAGLPAGELGPDDYDRLRALDAGAAPRGGAVTQAMIDAVLPTGAYVPPRASADGTTPAKRADGVDTCAVCMTDFEPGDALRTLPCFHRYHTDCVDPWLKQRGRADASCPACKHSCFAA